MASVSLWATNDGVRVNPETGRYFEDRRDVHGDYPTGAYRERNAVWEGRTGVVRLKAARNEFVAFQVVVEAAEPVKGIRLELGRLTGPGGRELTGRNVALFKTWHVEVEKASSGFEETSLGPGWYPDALIPAEGGELVLDLPDESNGIGRGQKAQSVWVDIYVPGNPSEAPPGGYVGVLRASGPAGGSEVRVELQVWDFGLPDEIHCRGDIYNNSLNHMDPEIELLYFQMAQQHRFQPGIVYHRPGLKLEGARVELEWEAYDARLDRYLDGSAYTDRHGYWGPCYGAPIDHIILPFDCGKKPGGRNAWPMKRPEGGSAKEFEGVWVETGRQIREHFEGTSARQRVERIAFLEGLDEAYNEEAYAEMIYYCKLLREGMGETWFKHRIDGGYSREAMEKLHPYVDLWVCHTLGFDAETVAHFRKKGVETWCYGPMIYERRENSACGSNTFLDLDMLTCRGLAWATWKHRCGYCEWEFEWAGDRAWTKALNWVTPHVEYNGSGLLIYRGEVIGRPGPVPSMRLKAHRRGFQDYEYFWMLREAGREREADETVNSVIHGVPFGKASVGNTNIWKNDPEAWEAARMKAGAMLDKGL